jgi:hypothetical protein
VVSFFVRRAKPGEIETLLEEAIRLFQTSHDPEKVHILSWGLAEAFGQRHRIRQTQPR